MFRLWFLGLVATACWIAEQRFCPAFQMFLESIMINIIRAVMACSTLWYRRFETANTVIQDLSSFHCSSTKYHYQNRFDIRFLNFPGLLIENIVQYLGSIWITSVWNYSAIFKSQKDTSIYCKRLWSVRNILNVTLKICNCWEMQIAAE